MNMITLSSAGPCHNYIEFTLLLHMPLAGHSRFPTLPPSLTEGLLEPRRTCTDFTSLLLYSLLHSLRDKVRFQHFPPLSDEGIFGP